MKPKFSFAAFLLLLFTLNCGGDDPIEPLPEETAGPISGSVSLFSSRGLPELNEGMTVSIEGTNLSTVTDRQGNYNFPSVPFGNYELKFEKEGFGTFFKPVEHDKGFREFGTRLIDISLGMKSSTAIYELLARLNQGAIETRVVTAPIGTGISPVYVTYFFGDDVDVSNSVNQGVVGPLTFSEGTAGNIVNFSKERLAEMGFETGETVYIRVYGDSFHTNFYQGPEGTVHPNVKEPGSGISSFVLRDE